MATAETGAKPDALSPPRRTVASWPMRRHWPSPTHHPGSAGGADACQSGGGRVRNQAEKLPERPTDKSAGGGEVVRLDRFRKK